MKDVKKERLFELLADQAFFDLSDEEIKELQQLKTEFPELREDDSFEISVAAINLAALDLNEEMPAHLRAKIEVSANEFFSQAKISEKASEPSLEKQKDFVFNAEANTRKIIETEPRKPFWQWLGWAVAAAACVALAFNLWANRNQTPPEIVKNSTVVQTPSPELSASQQRELLLSKTSDIIQTSWSEAAPKKEKTVSGDVVWSNSEQKGYMRFRGLPPNNPNQETYQLWIFDEEQDEKTPINGGVFDVDANGEVVVPIRAEIKVRKPKMFAVTKEKPGGVVVSKRETIVTIAKV